MPEIRDDYYRWRIALSGALIVLLFAEVLPFVLEIIKDGYRQAHSISVQLIEKSLAPLGFVGGPLMVLVAGTLYSRKIGLLSFLGLSSLATGIFVIFALHVGDQTGGVLKILSLLVYWVAGFIALFTFSGNDSD